MTQRKSKIGKAKPVKREVPEYKLKIVEDLISDFKKYKTVLVASMKGLPSSQFHLIKKNLRGKAELRVVKRSIVMRAIENSGKGDLKWT